VTKKDLKELYDQKNPKLKFIADISCDIDGGIEATQQICYLDKPFYVYNPDTEEITYGVKGKGPVILAIDHLPTEIPRTSSDYFSDRLMPFLPKIAKANYNDTLEKSGLPAEIQKAVIVWNGKLTKKYEYLHKYLD
jgi:alpha-aminoadipic semialdehyde synthase